MVPAPTLKLIVELAPELIGLGLKPAVVPAGSPLALRVTVCAEPLVIAVMIVVEVLPPWTAETLLGLALIEKSDGTVLGGLNAPKARAQLDE